VLDLPTLPCAIPPELLAESPYGPGGFLIDRIESIDPEKHVVVVRMPTHEDLPLTREQNAHPVRHPRHVSGGLMVHMTGMVAFVHTYYVLGLRHSDGWIGYGGRIHSARFRNLAPPGEPLMLECTVTQIRKRATRVIARYAFRFTQGDKIIYEGDQTAMWLKIDESTPLPSDDDA
jgi:3-hydroxymyristoyl/3-hydroxydecanoyl-(acyl carrier protein) dehydratase